MKTATIEQLGGGATEEPGDAATTTTIEKSDPLPLTVAELHYPTNILNTLLVARLLLRHEPMPRAPHYRTIPDECLADGIELAKRSRTKLPGSFVGVPKPCKLEGCGAKCIPSVTMGGAVQLGEIPRGSCQNTLSFNTEVEAHDKEIAAYNKRHPEQQEAFETDTVSQMAGQPETEAAMAHGLGVSSDLVHEMDALG